MAVSRTAEIEAKATKAALDEMNVIIENFHNELKCAGQAVKSDYNVASATLARTAIEAGAAKQVITTLTGDNKGLKRNMAVVELMLSIELNSSDGNILIARVYNRAAAALRAGVADMEASN